jgi:sugar phosphate isomerase/epimerase
MESLLCRRRNIAMTRVMDRRNFLFGNAAAAIAGVAAFHNHVFSDESSRLSLDTMIGITTGGLDFQRINRILTAFTLPAFMRDELGMRLIDFNTRWLTSYEPGYVDRLRMAADDADCFFSNLKVNHQIGDLYSQDANERKLAMANARQQVEVAETLGARWIRFPVPKISSTDASSKVSAHRELALFAEERGIQLLVENGGWLKSDPDSIQRVLKAIGRNVAAGPDTGNWDDDIRFEALKKTFPDAVTCDFKVYDLDENNHHAKYDIRRCFDIGRNAGFRGPWAIEHWNADTKAYVQETIWLRDQLANWMAASE